MVPGGDRDQKSNWKKSEKIPSRMEVAPPHKMITLNYTVNTESLLTKLTLSAAMLSLLPLLPPLGLLTLLTAYTDYTAFNFIA